MENVAVVATASIPKGDAYAAHCRWSPPLEEIDNHPSTHSKPLIVGLFSWTSLSCSKIKTGKQFTKPVFIYSMGHHLTGIYAMETHFTFMDQPMNADQASRFPERGPVGPGQPPAATFFGYRVYESWPEFSTDPDRYMVYTPNGAQAVALDIRVVCPSGSKAERLQVLGEWIEQGRLLEAAARSAQLIDMNNFRREWDSLPWLTERILSEVVKASISADFQPRTTRKAEDFLRSLRSSIDALSEMHDDLAKVWRVGAPKQNRMDLDGQLGSFARMLKDGEENDEGEPFDFAGDDALSVAHEAIDMARAFTDESAPPVPSANVPFGSTYYAPDDMKSADGLTFAVDGEQYQITLYEKTSGGKELVVEDNDGRPYSHRRQEFALAVHPSPGSLGMPREFLSVDDLEEAYSIDLYDALLPPNGLDEQGELETCR